jgi:formiminotetrahydrofolate cyclodeaminase
MERFTEMPLHDFLEKMSERTIPSPAAGSALGVTLAMAVSLLHLSGQGILKEPESVPAQNAVIQKIEFILSQSDNWRKRALSLADLDADIVYRMVRHGDFKEDEHPKASYEQINRLKDKEWDPEDWTQIESLSVLGDLALLALQVGHYAAEMIQWTHSCNVNDLKVVTSLCRTVTLGVIELHRYNSQSFSVRVIQSIEDEHRLWKLQLQSIEDLQ